MIDVSTLERIDLSAQWREALIAHHSNQLAQMFERKRLELLECVLETRLFAGVQALDNKLAQLIDAGRRFEPALVPMFSDLRQDFLQ